MIERKSLVFLNLVSSVHPCRFLYVSFAYRPSLVVLKSQTSQLVRLLSKSSRLLPFSTDSINLRLFEERSIYSYPP